MAGELIVMKRGELVQAIPEMVQLAGKAAKFAWDEFFAGQLRNPHTRAAYRLAVVRFLSWSEGRGLALAVIMPADVGKYLDDHPGSIATKKLHLAALRRFFDRLVLRHAIVLNPAASVRGERYSQVEGKTPMLPVEDWRKLLAALDTSNLVGLRDRAILGVLSFTAVRAGAIAGLRVLHLIGDPGEFAFRFMEKGGKSREIPIRHDLEKWVNEYLTAAKIDRKKDKDSHLFRSVKGKTNQLKSAGINRKGIWELVKRRLKDAGLPDRYSPHSFRVKVVTELLDQGVSLEDVQRLAGHADPRTTGLYDRRSRVVTRNIVERIPG